MASDHASVRSSSRPSWPGRRAAATSGRSGEPAARCDRGSTTRRSSSPTGTPRSARRGPVPSRGGWACPTPTARTRSFARSPSIPRSPARAVPLGPCRAMLEHDQRGVHCRRCARGHRGDGPRAPRGTRRLGPARRLRRDLRAPAQRRHRQGADALSRRSARDGAARARCARARRLRRHRDVRQGRRFQQVPGGVRADERPLARRGRGGAEAKRVRRAGPRAHRLRAGRGREAHAREHGVARRQVGPRSPHGARCPLPPRRRPRPAGRERLLRPGHDEVHRRDASRA